MSEYWTLQNERGGLYLVDSEEDALKWCQDDYGAANVVRPLRVFMAHDVVAAEQAAYERAAQLVEPKSPRPCDCEVCDCGNSGDLSAVVQWDEATRLAADIRALGADK